MFGFGVVWLAQVVSLLGTGMTQFALTIWAWQVTGQATALSLVGFFGYFPRIVLTPLAGALADRWNRKALMIASNLAAGLATVTIFILYKTSGLRIWNLFAAAAFSGAFGSLQFPAHQASIPMMLPKEQYTRANTMLGLAHSISSVFAPMTTGALQALIGIGGIMTIDIVTFSFAIGTLLIVSIPQPAAHHVAAAKRRNLPSDCAFGFRYVAASWSLTGLPLLCFALNLLMSLTGAVLSPMILSRTGNNELVLGTVQMLFGISGVVGRAVGIPVAGVLADRTFEPLMGRTSALARVLVPLVGRGPGAGMGLMFVLIGLLGAAGAIAGFAHRPIREIERILPDAANHSSEEDAPAIG
jgi:DHA3 family macrolide efflux protein-like MFS transporter